MKDGSSVLNLDQKSHHQQGWEKDQKAEKSANKIDCSLHAARPQRAVMWHRKMFRLQATGQVTLGKFRKVHGWKCATKVSFTDETASSQVLALSESFSTFARQMDCITSPSVKRTLGPKLEEKSAPR
jgi:ribosomal protein L35AE/L33A